MKGGERTESLLLENIVVAFNIEKANHVFYL